MSGACANLFPQKPKWDVDQIPDLPGETYIGRETVKLINKTTVYIAARNLQKVQGAIDDLRGKTGKTAFFVQVHLAEFNPNKDAVSELFKLEQRLDVLFNSARPMYPWSVELGGYDIHCGTKLLRSMIVSAKTSPEGKARVINTSSTGYSFRIKAGTMKLYSRSKRYAEQGIVSDLLHPANHKTDLRRPIPKVDTARASHGYPRENFTLYPAPMGALTQLYAGINYGARVGNSEKETTHPEPGREL
ncbi:hypothetical protein C8T65DRAFT_709373 [Cerioporus squamosus]|nr:hypothetical protein C8T65DRAFT_709373 [Cerioporus squamosus]